MNHSFRTIIVCVIVMAALSGCGKQHKAEEVVKDFLDVNLKENNYSISFIKIDSTRLVTDSAVNAMRENAKKNTAFKNNIKYNSTPSQKVYMFTKAVIRFNEDTIRHTFYLTPDLTQVVSFKDN